MNLPQFIRLEKTLEAAMNYRSNPDMQFFYFGGVQLLPTVKIRQRTENRGGVVLPDLFKVEVMSMCGDVLNLLEPLQFKVETGFNDANGFPQIEWTLVINYDAGYRPVYLRISNSTGLPDQPVYYSSPFYVTTEQSKYVTRWFYRNNTIDAYLAITLQIHYVQDDDSEELSTYDRRSTGKRTTLTNDLTAIEIWRTRPIDYKIFSLIRRMIACRFTYSSDDNETTVVVRTSKNEVFQTPKLEGKENHGQQELILVRDKDDSFATVSAGGKILWSSTEVLMSDTNYRYSRNNP